MSIILISILLAIAVTAEEAAAAVRARIRSIRRAPAPRRPRRHTFT